MTIIKINVPNRMHYFMKRHPKKDWDEFILKSIDKELKQLQLNSDIRCCKEGEKDFKRGECTSFEELIKEMGLEKEFAKKKIKKKKTYARKK